MATVASFGQTEGVAENTVVLGKELMPKDTTKARRFTNRLIAPKGEWQTGLSVMYADFSSRNSEYMMLLQGWMQRLQCSDLHRRLHIHSLTTMQWV